jgi:thioredoxin 1
MPIKHVKTLDELMTIVSREQKAIIIKFYARWCGPCKMITPIFKQYSESPRYKDAIVFVEVDIDESPAVAERFGVTSMPTFKAIRVRKIINEFVGGSKENLQSMVNLCC